MNKNTKGPFTSRRRRNAGRIAAAAIIVAIVVILLLELQEFAHLNFGRFYFPR